MNNKFLLICLVLSSVVLSSAQGQTAMDDGQMTLYQSAHYEVKADSSLDATTVEALVYEFEANYTLFSEIFTSATQKPENLLNVKIFKDKESFDKALSSENIYNRSNYIYLYYDDPAKNVLMIYPIENENEERAQLARHGFFSYIFDSLPTLPTWIREGLALYYESLIYNEAGEAIVPLNRLYMDDLKSAAKDSPITLKALMSLDDKDGQFEKNSFERNLLYSWGIVNFLMFSDNESYRQVVPLAISQTSAEKTQQENGQAVVSFISSSYPNLQADFDNFLNTEMGYVELVNVMREAYGEKDYAKAGSYAENAKQAEPEAYVPEYYLGLVAFQNDDYTAARMHYTQALSLGAPEALINFAMGYLSYYGEKDYQQAADYFQRAKTEDPVRFGQKVDLIMKNLTQDSQSPYKKKRPEGNPTTPRLPQGLPSGEQPPVVVGEEPL